MNLARLKIALTMLGITGGGSSTPDPLSWPTAEGAPQLYPGTQGNLLVKLYGSVISALGGDGFRLGSTKYLGWHSIVDSTALSLALYMDAANALAQRNGTNAQRFNIYNTYTDDSNYERGGFMWQSDILYINTQGVGTGGNRSISIDAAGWVLTSAQGAITTVTEANLFRPNVNGGSDLGKTAVGWRRLYIDYTNTATVGAVTIDKAAGRVNIAAAGTSVVVTNSLVTANSKVFCTIATNDGTAVLKNVVPAAGSFTIRLNAAATAQTAIDFFVVNAD